MIKVSQDAQRAQIRRDLEDLYDRATEYGLLPWEMKIELEKYIVRSGCTRCIQQYTRGYYDAMMVRLNY